MSMSMPNGTAVSRYPTARTLGSRLARGGALAGIAVIGLAPLASAALGLTSYEGSDYSQDLNTASQVKACDREADARDVFAQFKVRGVGDPQRVYDSNGANNACVYSGSYGDNAIYAHRIVEDVTFGPDLQGRWKYPS